jgi:hypothetical protein
MIQGSRYDICLINDELAFESDQELLNKVKEAMGRNPCAVLLNGHLSI